MALRTARAWIWVALSGHLLSDKERGCLNCRWLPFLRDIDGTRKYSWGSAVLCNLYTCLGYASHNGHIQMHGCMILVQYFAWERMKRIVTMLTEKRNCISIPNDPRYAFQGRPCGSRWRCKLKTIDTPKDALKIYRDIIDRMVPADFIWRPYADMVETLPPYCLEARELWSATVPVICDCTVEWHRTNRVMRQFGRLQGIPVNPFPAPSLETMTDGPRDKTDSLYTMEALQRWPHRRRYVLQGVEGNGIDPGYFDWYR